MNFTAIATATDSAILYATTHISYASNPSDALDQALNSLDRKATEEGKVASITRYTLRDLGDNSYLVYFGEDDD